jgi:hypothetical protein
MSVTEAYEPTVLDAILAHYEADGFDVFLHPASSKLPLFMRGFRPDAIALRGKKKVAIEITRSQGQSAERLSQLRSLFDSHPDWELVVVSANPRSPESSVEIVPAPIIDDAIRQVEGLITNGVLPAALMMGWAVLEAVGRALLSDQLVRQQPPTKLVEVLATEGLLTPSEADVLRNVAATRNATAHGQLDAKLDPEQLKEMVVILRTLRGLLGKKARESG